MIHGKFFRSHLWWLRATARRLDRENLRRKQCRDDFLTSRHFPCLLAHPILGVLARVTRLSGRYQIGRAIFQGKYPSVIKLSVYRRRRLEPSRVIPSTFFSDTVYTCIVCKASSVGVILTVGRWIPSMRRAKGTGSGGSAAAGSCVRKGWRSINFQARFLALSRVVLRVIKHVFRALVVKGKAWVARIWLMSRNVTTPIALKRLQEIRCARVNLSSSFVIKFLTLQLEENV